jgi:CheY-like chemotaxis protein
LKSSPPGRNRGIKTYAKIEKESATDRSTAKPIISEKAKHKIRILVAEDNPVNQEVAQAMLKKMGRAADVVSDGQEAVDALQAIRYDLVLMDCHMPEMDGFEVTRVIRRDGSKAQIGAFPSLPSRFNKRSRRKCLPGGWQ